MVQILKSRQNGSHFVQNHSKNVLHFMMRTMKVVRNLGHLARKIHKFLEVNNKIYKLMRKITQRNLFLLTLQQILNFLMIMKNLFFKVNEILTNPKNIRSKIFHLCKLIVILKERIKRIIKIY